MKPGFSSRTRWELTENALERARRELRASGADTVDLTVTNPTRVGLARLRELRAVLDGLGDASYAPEPLGMSGTREAIARHLLADEDIHADPSAMFLSASTSEAYAWLFKLLCDPGDDVLIPTPSYPLFGWLAGLESVVVRPYSLVREERFRVDLGALERAIGPRTRAIVTVSPNNPTGTFLHPDDARAIDALASAHGLAVIADEVFRTFPLEPASPGRSCAGEREALTFVLDGLSKRCASPGLKLAFTCAFGPAELVRAALARLEVIADTYLSVATPIGLGLPACLSAERSIRAEIDARLRRNLATLDAAMERRGAALGAQRLRVEGGWSVIVEAPRTEPDAERAMRALVRHGVLVHPGWFFDMEREGSLVLSLLPEAERFEAGVERLLDAIEAAG
ncbi:MAG: pyridoxal phosphate-dependent aminotransferase [Polyangiaceae bacterium]